VLRDICCRRIDGGFRIIYQISYTHIIEFESKAMSKCHGEHWLHFDTAENAYALISNVSTTSSGLLISESSVSSPR
jgi:hypothetical protein